MTRCLAFSGWSADLNSSLWFSGVWSPRAHWPCEPVECLGRGRSAVAVMVVLSSGPGGSATLVTSEAGRRPCVDDDEASSGGGGSADETDHAAGAPEVDVTTTHQAQLGAAGGGAGRGRAGGRHLFIVAHPRPRAL